VVREVVLLHYLDIRSKWRVIADDAGKMIPSNGYVYDGSV
jgi:hypothetical protein